MGHGGVTGRTAHIAVVGAGPRGTAVLERLIAGLGHRAARLHVVEPRSPGAGRVWHPGQPEHLLMNTLAGHATAFPDSSVRMAGPATTGPAFLDWARDHAPDLAPWDHPGRAEMGRYLVWAHERIVALAAPGIQVVHHPARAVALDEESGDSGGGAGRLRLGLDDGSALVVDAVVLATGHTDRRPAPEQLELAAAARESGLVYVPPGQPHEAPLDLLPPGEPVLVRGLALNFFDHMALLTHGRGGRFTTVGGRLRYRPSGREPRLIVGSGRGVPYLARGQAPGRMPEGHTLRHFDGATVERLTSREPGTVGFMAEVWPLIAKEAGAAWYRALLAVRPDAVRTPGFLERYAAVEHGSEQWTDLLDREVPDPADRFDLLALDRPLAGLRFADRTAFGGWLAERLREDLEAARDPGRSPLKAAAGAVAAVKGQVRRIVISGVLTGPSHRELSWFRAFGAHLSSGPPALRIAELIALHEAGVVEFLGARPTVTVDRGESRFHAVSPTTGGPAATTHALLDAWLPGADLASTADPLLRGLLVSGLARPHVAGGADAPEATGAVDVELPELRVRRTDGRPNRGLYAFGIPTEGIHWNTAIGARAHANADMFRQADAIAQAVLRSLPEE
ncbi:FAD-binding protein [Streptomyces sp. K1PN6]|uniref:FAD-binding protein n=1 Tax=Streptomyces acidicola TaxID=2596892 RepID=A0A5N8WQU6_9ACTN|nr:FAD-binding protein [Streptomyces acidicola]